MILKSIHERKKGKPINEPFEYFPLKCNIDLQTKVDQILQLNVIHMYYGLDTTINSLLCKITY